MRTFTVRMLVRGEVIATTQRADNWIAAVNKATRELLDAECAPQSAFLNCYEHMREGETLFNGARVSKHLAEAYNRVNDHIHAWKAHGKQPPEHLLNGRHNLIASAAA